MSASSHPVIPATLNARGIRRELGGRVVLDDVAITVDSDTRVGVVGPNGVGKSTLLRVLAGLEAPDAGSVEVAPRTATVGYLAQEPERRAAETVREYLHRVTGVRAADEALQRSAAGLTAGGGAALEAYADALETWQSLGGADLDARVEATAADLGLPLGVLDQLMTTLSGGQAARVALGGIVLSRFDVTLLDEPTNDLDFAGLAQLEAFVGGRRGGVVIVSHDREFLENTISSVLELDEHDHRASLYRGGWRAYLEERATSRRHEEEAYAEYQSRRGTLTDRAQRERQWASSGATRERKAPRDNDKAQRDFRLNRTEQLAARARRTERALSRLESVEKPWEGWDLRFSISEASRSGTVVARLEGAILQRDAFCLGPIDLEIDWGDRLSLIGPNGSGKTTVLQAILGELELSGGRRSIGPSVVPGVLGQARSSFLDAPHLLGAFIATTGLDLAAARSLLAKFGLGADHVGRSARSLSPGERTRAELATFQARGVNLMVLDEPTNHLDVPAVEQLEQALDGYRGTLIVVTHDRQLLEHLAISRTFDVSALRRS